MVNALLTGLELSPVPLAAQPIRKDIVGIGLTDSDIYAKRLRTTFAYTNAYYHKEPRLDLLNPDPDSWDCADFIICSDVLEHVHPPVGLAFQNLFRLLRSGGVLVLTVPLAAVAHAKEHFPHLNDYRLEVRGNETVLVNKTATGGTEEFHDLVFHGGQGETLEMRLFSREWLFEELSKAGFSRIELIDNNLPEYGILWENDPSVPVVAWKERS